MNLFCIFIYHGNKESQLEFQIMHYEDILCYRSG